MLTALGLDVDVDAADETLAAAFDAIELFITSGVRGISYIQNNACVNEQVYVAVTFDP